MHTITFKLKQHTPLIHFQHDQDNATLRATEVKPKLDRYIFTMLGKYDNDKLKDETLSYKKGVDFAKNKNWLIGTGEHYSLDYKLIINGAAQDKYLLCSYLSDDKKRVLENNNIKYICDTSFFAEESSVSNIFETEDYIKKDGSKGKRAYDIIPVNIKKITKWGLFTNSEIDLRLTSVKTDLLSEIENHLSNFFLFQNFGTRQSKGFGCFTVSEKIINSKSSAVEFDENEFKKSYSVIYRLNETLSDFTSALKKIQSIYKLTKSGRGSQEHGGYKKSLLFLYYVSEGRNVRWEKRKIKQGIKSNAFYYDDNGNQREISLFVDSGNSSVYDNSANQSWTDSPSPFSYEFLRALLGLAEQFEFKSRPTRFKYAVKIRSNDGIERFKSPITFKLINKTLYVLANDISPDILHKDFSFDLKLKEGTQLKTDPGFIRNNFIDSPLYTPSQFNIGDFFDFIFNRSQEKLSNFIKVENQLFK